MSPYWQHNEPIKCPKRHQMIWLGLAFWICERCHVIYVQVKEQSKCRPKN